MDGPGGGLPPPNGTHPVLAESRVEPEEEPANTQAAGSISASWPEYFGHEGQGSFETHGCGTAPDSTQKANEASAGYASAPALTSAAAGVASQGRHLPAAGGQVSPRSMAAAAPHSSAGDGAGAWEDGSADTTLGKRTRRPTTKAMEGEASSVAATAPSSAPSAAPAVLAESIIVASDPAAENLTVLRSATLSLCPSPALPPGLKPHCVGLLLVDRRKAGAYENPAVWWGYLWCKSLFTMALGRRLTACQNSRLHAFSQGAAEPRVVQQEVAPEDSRGQTGGGVSQDSCWCQSTAASGQERWGLRGKPLLLSHAQQRSKSCTADRAGGTRDAGVPTQRAPSAHGWRGQGLKVLTGCE